MNQRCIACALWAALCVPAASMAAQPKACEYQGHCACEPAQAATAARADTALAAATASAEPAASTPTTPSTASIVPVASGTPMGFDAVAAFGPPAGVDRLEAARGGDGGIASDTRLTGTVTGNTATQVATGSNIIQSGSFANASGVPIVIQNTGANVLIQNATVINLQLK